ncbi:hypothetical protein K439DRAFT_1659193 [Ramaria rubella]|nr:hypothetical protein K439DRAFT_1659193 [Ramaria rubella]
MFSLLLRFLHLHLFTKIMLLMLLARRLPIRLRLFFAKVPDAKHFPSLTVECCAKEFKTACTTNVLWLQCGTHHTSNMKQLGLLQPQEPAPEPGALENNPMLPVAAKPYANTSDIIGPHWKTVAVDARNKAEEIQKNGMNKHRLKMAQSHTIILIIWSEANRDPVVYPYVPETFPTFVLGAVTPLVQDRDLAIKSQDWLSTWNPQMCEWELHSLETPRTVVSGQRLLYKVIHTISNQIPNDLCPGLLKELASQPVLRKRKRGAENLVGMNGIPSSSKLLPTSVSSSSSPSHNSPRPTITTQMSSRVSSIAQTKRVLKSSRASSGASLDQDKLKHRHLHTIKVLKKAKEKAKAKGKKKEKKEKRDKGKGNHISKKAKKNLHTWPTGFYVSEVSAGLEYVAEGKQ